MPNSIAPDFAIIGTGRLARALAQALLAAGEPLGYIAGRNPESTRHLAAQLGVPTLSIPEVAVRVSRIILAISDEAIPKVAAALAAAGFQSGVALHTCGVRGPEALADLARHGVQCGVFHPLQTFFGGEHDHLRFRDSTITLSGDRGAVTLGLSLASALHVEPLEIDPRNLSLYHAAAVMASNYLAALLDSSAMLMSAAGIAETQALRALGPLARTALENSLQDGPRIALTGPISRGDIQTVEQHLLAIASALPELSNLYHELGKHTLEMAGTHLLPETREALRVLLASK